MNEPFHYRPLSEVIAEYEKDPVKKKLLDIERAKRLDIFLSYSGSQINVTDFCLKKQLASDIADSQEQEDGR